MFSRCLFCHRDLPANESLEHFPVGRRVAYDPGRGRLWAVCPACRRWNLAPIEERWEALEELEKAVTDRAKLLSQTDNIALLRTPELELVRVGRANLTEESWWRYGAELVRRRRTYQVITAAGITAAVGLMAGGAAFGASLGGWWAVTRAVRQIPKLGRTLKFGRSAWRGRAVCDRCGRELTRIPFRDRGALAATTDAGDGLALHLRCLHCERRTGHLLYSSGKIARAEKWPDPADGRRARRTERRRRRSPELPPPTEGTGFLITGVEAEHLMRRVLAYQNFAGGKEAQVRDATSLIQQAGSAPSLARGLVAPGRRLATIDATSAIALEIAVNEDRERRLLELELAELEQHWKEEEELAAIVDGELTWVPQLPGGRAPGAAPGLLDVSGHPLA